MTLNMDLQDDNFNNLYEKLQYNYCEQSFWKKLKIFW